MGYDHRLDQLDRYLAFGTRKRPTGLVPLRALGLAAGSGTWCWFGWFGESFNESDRK